MGFGNHVPFERKEPPDPTFGELREDIRGYSVTCRKCGHYKFVPHKADKFLRGRLPDDLKLRRAGEMFRCTECNHNQVRVQAENVWDMVRRIRNHDTHL